MTRHQNLTVNPGRPLRTHALVKTSTPKTSVYAKHAAADQNRAVIGCSDVDPVVLRTILMSVAAAEFCSSRTNTDCRIHLIWVIFIFPAPSTPKANDDPIR